MFFFLVTWCFNLLPVSENKKKLKLATEILQNPPFGMTVHISEAILPPFSATPE